MQRWIVMGLGFAGAALAIGALVRLGAGDAPVEASKAGETSIGIANADAHPEIDESSREELRKLLREASEGAE